MTTVDSACDIWGAYNICPADTIYIYDGDKVELQAELWCPLSSVTKSNYIEASQKGRCECHAQLVGIEGEEPMNCNCYACPQGSRFGFAYDCQERIYGACTQFNCDGECNGRFKFGLDSLTDSPTPSPVDAAMTTNPFSTAVAIMSFTLFWMIRH
jgi:hypothetical protein